MRTLLIILAVAAVLVLVPVVIGAFLPKAHTATASRWIKASQEEVFALISGPQDWRTDLKNYELYRDGDRRMLRETDLHGQTISYEITEAVPPTLLRRRIADKNLPFGGTWTYRLAHEGEGCRVTITEDGEVYNPLFRFVSRFVMGETSTINRQLAMLESAAEKRAASASGSR